MAYDYDIFVSYRRTPTVGKWVKNHLVPRLTDRLNEISPKPVRLSCDFEMASGVLWPEELKRRLRASGMLLAVWSADYFRSSWCMAEWNSFKQREATLNMFSQANPGGLIYPIRYADGDYYHPDALLAQCRKDFSKLNYPDESFQMSARYIEFDDSVQDMAAELVERLVSLPNWQEDFPIVEPAPMPTAILARPLL